MNVGQLADRHAGLDLGRGQALAAQQLLDELVTAPVIATACASVAAARRSPGWGVAWEVMAETEAKQLLRTEGRKSYHKKVLDSLYSNRPRTMRRIAENMIAAIATSFVILGIAILVWSAASKRKFFLEWTVYTAYWWLASGTICILEGLQKPIEVAIAVIAPPFISLIVMFNFYFFSWINSRDNRENDN